MACEGLRLGIVGGSTCARGDATEWVLDEGNKDPSLLTVLQVRPSEHTEQVILFLGNALCKEFPSCKCIEDEADGVPEQELRGDGSIEPACIPRVPKEAVNSMLDKLVLISARLLDHVCERRPRCDHAGCTNALPEPHAPSSEHHEGASGPSRHSLFPHWKESVPQPKLCPATQDCYCIGFALVQQKCCGGMQESVVLSHAPCPPSARDTHSSTSAKRGCKQQLQGIRESDTHSTTSHTSSRPPVHRRPRQVCSAATRVKVKGPHS